MNVIDGSSTVYPISRNRTNKLFRLVGNAFILHSTCNLFQQIFQVSHLSLSNEIMYVFIQIPFRYIYSKIRTLT